MKIVVIGLVLISPIVINIIDLIAQDTGVSLLTGTALFFPIVLLIKLVDMLGQENNIEKLLGICSFVIIIIVTSTYALSDNAKYMAMKLTYNKTYAVAERIINRIEENDGYYKGIHVMIAGIVDDSNFPTNSKIYEMATGGVTENEALWKSYKGSKITWEKFLNNYCGYNVQMCSDKTYKKITETEEFKNMKIFPEQNSVKVINGIMVVKLTNNPPRP